MMSVPGCKRCARLIHRNMHRDLELIAKVIYPTSDDLEKKSRSSATLVWQAIYCQVGGWAGNIGDCPCVATVRSMRHDSMCVRSFHSRSFVARLAWRFDSSDSSLVTAVRCSILAYS